MTKLHPNGRGHVTHDPFFLKFGPNYIFRIGEDKHFKFCALIDTEEY